MKSKLTNFISLAVVMFVLTAVFTVSALADITGGFGVIEELDTAKTYEAASVTLNAAGNGYADRHPGEPEDRRRVHPDPGGAEGTCPVPRRHRCSQLRY